MAQLEKFYSTSDTFTSNDGSFHLIPITVPTGKSWLITGIYFTLSVNWLGSSTTSFRLVDGVTNPIIFSKPDLVNPLNLINSNSQFIMTAGNQLSLQFSMATTGTYFITIFYKEIPGQTSTNGIIYGAISGRITTSANTIVTIPNSTSLTNIFFYKSLIIYNNNGSATHLNCAFYQNVSPTIIQFKTFILTSGQQTTLLISNDDRIYQMPSPGINNSNLVLSTNGGSPDYTYHLSYYYDPLYTP